MDYIRFEFMLLSSYVKNYFHNAVVGSRSETY